MSNNNQQQKSFANIISREGLETFNKKEKEKFYIDNKILIKIKHKHSEKQLSIWEKKGRLIELTYEENPILLDEIINQYIEGSHSYWENDYLIESIKIKLENTLNNQQKEKIIEKEYRKYFKKLHKLELTYWYFLTEEGYIGYGTKNFLGHVKSEIQDNVIEDLITSNYINFHNYSLFFEWSEIEKIKGILHFLKEYKKEHFPSQSTTPISTNNKPLTLNQSLILLDEIISNYWNTWAELETTKKSRILSRLLNSNYDNIRKRLPLLEKKPSETSEQHQKDIKLISNLLNEILS